MFERFTDRARKVMALANQEAQRLHHDYIGTEHILLGIIKEGQGVAANILKNSGLDLDKVLMEVESIAKHGPNAATIGRLPQTPPAKHVIEWSIQEARQLNHHYVGTEHLLLGLLREHDGVAARVLANLGLSLETIRQEVLNLLGDARLDQTNSGSAQSEQMACIQISPERLARLQALAARQNKTVAQLVGEILDDRLSRES